MSAQLGRSRYKVLFLIPFLFVVVVRPASANTVSKLF